MTPWFIATKKFDASDARWPKYIAWSGLGQLDELVSLDASLCRTVLADVKANYWDHIVNEDFMLNFFTNLDFLRGEIATVGRKNLLCVFRNPASQPSPGQVPEGFEFVGYDLVEAETGTSALTNCGGFPKAFSNDELSGRGLIADHRRSRIVQEALAQQYPNEPHAHCNLWAVFRAS